MLVTPPGASTRLSGTSVLARSLASHGDAFQYRVLARPDAPELAGPVALDRVYRGGGLSRAARMLGRVVTGGGSAVHHYFFAPHPKAVHVVRGASLLARRPTIHTIPSAPAPELNPALLLFADRTVVMSESTALLFASAGAPTPHVIRPGTSIPEQEGDRGAARDILERTDNLLVMLQRAAYSPDANTPFGLSTNEPTVGWAQSLLRETRLLQDSPAAEGDPQLTLLLEDLELLLAQIVRAAGDNQDLEGSPVTSPETLQRVRGEIERNTLMNEI